MTLNLLLKVILNQYFLSTRCSFLISEEGCNRIQLPLGYSVVSVTVDSNETVQTVSEKLFHSFGCQVFILDLKNLASIISVVEHGFKNQNETFFHRKYIVIANNDINIVTSALFDTKEIHFIYDLLIISLNQSTSTGTSVLEKYDEEYHFWTHKYAGANSVLKAKFIDKWFSFNQSFLGNKNLFPDKIVSSFGKVYKIGFFPYPPYITYERDRTSNKIILDGVEGHILNGFFHKYNLTVEPILVEEGYWGYIFDSGSAYGLKGLLYKEKADIGVAACFANERLSRYFGMTSPILRIGVSCLVPAPKLIPSWITPLKAYSKLLWAAIFLTYIFIVALVYSLKMLLDHSATCTDLRYQNSTGRMGDLGGILLTIFGYQSKNNLKGCFWRTFSLFTLFTILILSRSYESGLSSILTIPSYRDSIETKDDFLNSNISWGGIQLADWLMYWKDDEEEIYRRAYKRYISTTSYEMLETLMNAGNFAPAFEKLSANAFHFPFPLKGNAGKLKLMKEDIHWDYSVFLLRKSAPIIPLLNKYISILERSGLINHWLGQASSKFVSIRQQISIKYRSQHGTAEYSKAVKIKLSHMAGVFGIFIVGNSIALLVFIAELIFGSGFHGRHTFAKSRDVYLPSNIQRTR